MTLSNKQNALLALIDRAYAAQNEWIASLSDAERELVGTPERWSAKDMLAHVTFWQQVMIDRLNMVKRGETPTLFGDFQPVNERIFAERNALPWQQVLSEAAAAYEAASGTEALRFARRFRVDDIVAVNATDGEAVRKLTASGGRLVYTDPKYSVIRVGG